MVVVGEYKHIFIMPKKEEKVSAKKICIKINGIIESDARLDV